MNLTALSAVCCDIANWKKGVSTGLRLTGFGIPGDESRRLDQSERVTAYKFFNLAVRPRRTRNLPKKYKPLRAPLLPPPPPPPHLIHHVSIYSICYLPSLLLQLLVTTSPSPKTLSNFILSDLLPPFRGQTAKTFC